MQKAIGIRTTCDVIFGYDRLRLRIVSTNPCAAHRSMQRDWKPATDGYLRVDHTTVSSLLRWTNFERKDFMNASASEELTFRCSPALKVTSHGTLSHFTHPTYRGRFRR